MQVERFELSLNGLKSICLTCWQIYLHLVTVVGIEPTLLPKSLLRLPICFTVIGCNGRISYLHTWESTTPCSTNIKLRYWLSHVGIEPTSYISDSPESSNVTYKFQKKPVTWANRTRTVFAQFSPS